MYANEREFMKRIQAQSVEIGSIYPPTHDGGYIKENGRHFWSPHLCSCRRKAAETCSPSHDGGYGYSCVGRAGTAQAVESLHSNQDENHFNLVFRVKGNIIKEF